MQRMYLPTLASTEVLPYLDSSEAGWDGLVAQAFHEPRKMECILPPDTDIELALFTGGPMRLEWRQLHAHASWTGLNVRSGDLILRAGINEPCELWCSSLSSTPTHSIVLHLSRDRLARTAEELAGRVAPHPMIVGRAGFQDPFLAQIALALWRELQANAPGGRLFAQSAAQLLTLYLLRHYTSAGHVAAAIPNHPGTLSPHQLRRVTAYIRDHASEDLTLEVLAQQTGFSPYHFARLFRQTTGETPHQFVLRERLAYARRLLESTDLSLTQVAAASGFADQSHFTHVFKRALRMTPSAYRRECR